MMSRFHIIEPVGQNQRRHVSFIDLPGGSTRVKLQSVIAGFFKKVTVEVTGDNLSCSGSRSRLSHQHQILHSADSCNTVAVH